MKNRVVITTNQILWTIILLNTSSDDWYIDYINDKLNYQIKLNDLEENINILILDKIEDIQDSENLGEYLNIINNGDISDNYIKTIYNNLEKTKKNCLCFSGIYKSKDGDYVFNQKEENSEEIFIPINKMNPIKKEFILKKFNNYIEGEFKKISAKFIDDILVYIDSDIDLNKTTNQETKEPFSIILTAYKTEKFIEECLDSIESQTYFENNDNYEILVGVDGCENTLNKLNEIKDKYRNLYIYMMKENRGTYMTTNALLNLIKYENVIRFDTDDIMEPNLVEDLVDFKNINDDDVIKLGYSDWREGKKINDYVLVNDGIIYFKKSVMDDIAGGYMPWECAADSELISRLKGRVKISGLHKRLFIRRIHDNSLTLRKDTGYKSVKRLKYNNQIKGKYNDDEVKIERVSSIVREDYTQKKNEVNLNIDVISMDNKLECIILGSDLNSSPFNNPLKMAEELYEDDENYYNTILVFAYNRGGKFEDFKKLHPNKKIIIYQFEQLYNNLSKWYNPNSTEKYVIDRTKNAKTWFDGVDEIWEYDLNNLIFLKKEGYKNIKHMPLRYANSLKRINNNHEKDIDVLFYGEMNDRRKKIINDIKKNHNVVVVPYSTFGEELYKYVDRSKIVLNLHYYDGKIQEQVRIFDLVINNKCVLSEKSNINYFGDLIIECDMDDINNKIDYLLENDRWKEYNNISEKFENKSFNITNTVVIIHLFYHELWDEIYKYLKNLYFYFDLYITLNIDDENSENMRKIILSKYPRANIFLIKNRGLDIGSFFVCINDIIKKNYKYEYLLKIHSKKSIFLDPINGEKWRKRNYETLIGDSDRIKKIINLFKSNKNIGMIGCKEDVFKKPKNFEHANKYYMEYYSKRLNIKDDNLEFFAGSMFWCKFEPFLEKFSNFTIDIDEFESGYKPDTLKSHAIERLLGSIMRDKKLELYPI